VYFRQPYTALVTSTISVKAGDAQLAFTTHSSAIIILSAGGDSNLWQDATGVIRLWGSNTFGQLGDGTADSRSQMANVSGITAPLVGAALGSGHALAAAETGAVYAWGDNYFGQLGTASSAPVTVPVTVPGLSDIIDVAVGDAHSLALARDGTVWSWGENQSGQLGDGTKANRATPARIPGLTNVIKIVAGARHSAALTADGSVWVWGSNEFGQIASDTTISATSPVAVTGLAHVTLLTSGREHLLAKCMDGTVWAWGDNHAGQLGLGSVVGTSTPQHLSGIVGSVVRLEAGANHSLAVCLDGTVYLWGANSAGQLGNGALPSSSVPAVSATISVRTAAAGADHVLVLHSDGTLQSWGLNRSGQLGTTTAGDFSNVPVNISVPEVTP
jgi:alpha-tubulin suppressor-like RCC1 family protein